MKKFNKPAQHDCYETKKDLLYSNYHLNKDILRLKQTEEIIHHLIVLEYLIDEIVAAIFRSLME